MIFLRGFMNILAAIKREERKLEKQLGKLNHQLSGVRAAAKALGGSAGREVVGVKKRVLSAAGRAAIVKAAKKRWAKVRKRAKKAAGWSHLPVISTKPQNAGLSFGLGGPEWLRRTRINLPCRLTPVLEKMLLICERTVLSVTPTIFAIFRGT
jgi:hypothetical protein